jgi:hypothetical protein
MGELTWTGERASTAWGHWGLGDLSDALQTVSRIVGPSCSMDQVSVYPPSGRESLPTVQLVVPDRLGLDGMRALVGRSSDLLVPLDAVEQDHDFRAVADDVLLCVRVRG